MQIVGPAVFSTDFGDVPMKFFELFKRRKMGPLSVSPVGLVIFFFLVAVFWKIADGVYQAKDIQGDLYSSINFARPIAIRARWIHEKTGKVPSSLDDLQIGKVKNPPQIAEVRLLSDQGVQLLFASPEALATKSMVLRVITREGEYFLECESGELPRGPLPHLCREKNNAERLSWPPAELNKALQSTR